MLEKILEALLKNTVLCTHRVPESPLPAGASKIGGIPDLPEGFVWPRYEGENWDGEKADRPMAFLAQINLTEVHPFDTDGLLPPDGMLSFFYEMETMQWGYAPAHAGCAGVIYTPAGCELYPADPPEDLDPLYCVPLRTLTFSAQDDLPPYEQFSLRHTLDTDAPWEDYANACQDLGAPLAEECGTRHKLLGYPDLIQGEIFTQCAKVTSGLDCGRGPIPLTEEQKERFRRESEDWCLLFQLSSFWDNGEELMFGDMGSVFFCIRKEDLAARRFGRVWLILQCG